METEPTYSGAEIDKPRRSPGGGGKFPLLGVAVLAVIVLAIVITVILLAKSIVRDAEAPVDLRSEKTLKISAVQEKVEAEDWISVELLPINEYSRPGIYLEEINSVVIHYVGNPATTAAQNRSYFAGLAQSGETYASSNFLIDLDGSILSCVPVDEVAYCSNKRNEDSISIECCHPDENGEFSEDTYASVIKLAAWLCLEFELTADDVIRHYDITGKECPLYYVVNEDEWNEMRENIADGIDALLAAREDIVPE